MCRWKCGMQVVTSDCTSSTNIGKINLLDDMFHVLILCALAIRKQYQYKIKMYFKHSTIYM